MDFRVFDRSDPAKHARYIQSHPMRNFWMWSHKLSTGPVAGKRRVILMGVAACLFGAVAIFLSVKTEVR